MDGVVCGREETSGLRAAKSDGLTFVYHSTVPLRPIPGHPGNVWWILEAETGAGLARSSPSGLSIRRACQRISRMVSV
ncbi:hypothetical protein CHELA20_53921 [Hyphomicrobiales bacterium]|nr:hypothetical protein CHELA41_21006 [Hyphomicrobiales bacterium]CAH1685216.1 hypothetical protein CHELA20_53921 [Hyphomicrobiales bacterium]